MLTVSSRGVNICVVEQIQLAVVIQRQDWYLSPHVTLTKKAKKYHITDVTHQQHVFVKPDRLH